MNEEIKRILKMVEEGKIDSDKATELIEALNKVDNTPQVYSPSVNTGKSGKMVRIKVISTTNDTVNVNIPVSFLKSIGNAVNNVKIPGVSDEQGIDVKMIMDAIDSGLEGKIVDVKSSNGDIVEVTIE